VGETSLKPKFVSGPVPAESDPLAGSSECGAVADVGTGKLAGLLLGRGLQVLPVEPDEDMLAALVADYRHSGPESPGLV